MTGLELVLVALVAGTTTLGGGVAGLWSVRRRRVRRIADRSAGLYALGLRSEDGESWSGVVRGREVHVTTPPGRGGPAVVALPCDQTGFRLAPRSWLGRLAPGRRTGDPAFDKAVKAIGPPGRLLAVLDQALRSELAACAGRWGLHLEGGLLHGRIPPSEVATAIPRMVELAEALEAPVEAVEEQLHRVALADPDPGVRVRAVSSLAALDTRQARHLLRDLAERHPDWDGSLVAATRLGDPELLSRLTTDPAAPADIVERARQTLASQQRTEGLRHLLGHPPGEDAPDEERLGHLQTVARLLRPGDDITPVVRWASTLQSPSDEVVDLLVLALTRSPHPEGAGAAVALLGRGTGAPSSLTVRRSAQLVQQAGDPDLAPEVVALTQALPDQADALRAALEALDVRRAVGRLQREADLHPRAERVHPRRGLRVDLAGTRADRPVSLRLEYSHMLLRVGGFSSRVAGRFSEVPTHPPSGALLSWMHADVRARLTDALQQVDEVRLGGGRVATATRRLSVPQLLQLLDALAGVAGALASLPDDRAARLVSAARAEPRTPWRCAFVRALPRDVLTEISDEVLRDPSPSVRLEAGVRLADAPTLVALAGDPEVPTGCADEALWALADQPELVDAVLAALSIGRRPGRVSIGALLERVETAPLPEHQRLLVHALEAGDPTQKRAAAALLGRVGDRHAVPALQRAAEGWRIGPLRDAARAAVKAIHDRSGAERGALSVVELTDEGGLSLASAPGAGRLTDLEE